MKQLLICLIFSVCFFPAIIGFGQRTYGKEECGELLNSWMEDLQQVKNSVKDTIGNPFFYEFNKWLSNVNKDIYHSGLRLFTGPDGVKSENLFDFLNRFYNIKMEGEYQIDDLIMALEAEPPLTQRFFKTILFLQNLYWYEKVIREQYLEIGIPAAEMFFKTEGNFETDISSIYKYVLDITENINPGNLDRDTKHFYEENCCKLVNIIYIDGLLIPYCPKTGESPKTESVQTSAEKFLQFFAKEILFFYGSSLKYKTSEFLIYNNLAEYPGNPEFGNNRYSTSYFKRLMAYHFRNEIENLIEIISEIKKMKCATEAIDLLGKIEVTTSPKSLQQSINRVIQKPTNPPPQGKALLLVEVKDSKGRYLQDTFFDFRKTLIAGDNLPFWSYYVNQYNEIEPGTYIIKDKYYNPSDSIIVTINAGEIKIVEYISYGAVKATFKNEFGREIPLGFSINYLRRNPNNSYMLDTIYYDVLYKANEKEANPGLYHVKPFMPPNYFPHMVSTEVEVKPKELIEVIVEGYGLLLVEAFSGIPEKWATRIDIFTKERNSKTKERTWLAYFNSNDTMHLAPGNYWMVAQYPIPVEREISIQSNSMLTERIENIGILLITNGTNSKEWVEITDMETARKTSVRNNTPVDIESGKKYTVAVFKSNGTIKTFTDVEIDPKQTTVIRW